MVTERPVVQVRLADAGDLFLTWRWVAGLKGYGIAQPPKDQVVEIAAVLAEALPRPGEAGLRGAFEGAMSSYDRELGLAANLAEVLWPEELTAELRHVAETIGRPLVRIQPSPRVAQVPWELIAVGGDTRLLDLADVAISVPVSLRRAPQPTGSSNAVVVVLDPKVPGFPPNSPLGSVLGAADSDPVLAELARRHVDAGDAVPSSDLFRRSDLDRDWLSETLRKGARRLMYVGHVSSAPVEGGQSEDAQLHLCCGTETTGFAEVVRTHRPLSAKDLLLGTLTSRADGVPGAQTWPAPPRVALIACESGGDLRFTESFGLASAMIHNGAELVTAARWVVPTTHAFHRLAGVAESVRPLSELIAAVDVAHDDVDPVGRLGAWQREQLAQWRTGGRIEHSPLLWAALSSIVAY